MAFFDDVVRTTQKAGKLVAEKATDVYDLTKTSYILAGLENELKDVLAQIGGYVLDADLTGASHEEEIAAALLKAKSLRADIEEAEKKKYDLKNQTVCPDCGKANEKGAAFCSACGKKLGE